MASNSTGLWTTHLSLPIEFNREQLDLVKTLVDLAQNFNLLNLKLCNDFHISVSKTFQIKNKMFEPLSENLEKEFEKTQKFELILQDILVLKSEEETNKYFLAFKLSNQNLMNEIVDRLNTCLKSMRLPSYYKNPTFHLSFASFNSSDTKFDDISQKIKDTFNKFQNTDLNRIQANRLQLKCGNKFYFISLE